MSVGINTLYLADPNTLLVCSDKNTLRQECCEGLVCEICSDGIGPPHVRVQWSGITDCGGNGIPTSGDVVTTLCQEYHLGSCVWCYYSGSLYVRTGIADPFGQYYWAIRLSWGGTEFEHDFFYNMPGALLANNDCDAIDVTIPNSLVVADCPWVKGYGGTASALAL